MACRLNPVGCRSFNDSILAFRVFSSAGFEKRELDVESEIRLESKRRNGRRDGIDIARIGPNCVFVGMIDLKTPSHFGSSDMKQETKNDGNLDRFTDALATTNFQDRSGCTMARLALLLSLVCLLIVSISQDLPEAYGARPKVITR